MNLELNFSDIFIQHQSDCISKYKKKNGEIRTHFFQSRYLSLFHFISNSSYWVRFNIDPVNKCVINKNYVDGKYLNEIHNFYNKCHLYDKLYKYILFQYVQLLNFESLKTLYIDSSFIHNVLCTDASRNPQFYNKTGLKIHVLSDSNRTPISFIISDASTSDTSIATKLFNELFIDISFVKTHTTSIIADSSYSSIFNLEFFTNLGFKCVFGFNKRHIKKDTVIEPANDVSKDVYKTRHIPENCFAIIKRFPVLLNCYEKTINSYKGLLLFALSSSLCKRYNIIVRSKNNSLIKAQSEKERLARKEKDKLARLKKIENLKKAKIIRELKSKQEKEQKEQLNIDISNKIWNIIDKRIIRNKYNSKIKQYNKNINQQDQNKKIGRPKNITFEKYKDMIKNQLTNNIKNNALTKITKFTTFYDKSAYIIEADPFTFTDKKIRESIQTIDITRLINEYTNDFFT